MKVKLLKKIRKKYSIVYYPNGFKFDDYVYHKKRHVVYGIYNLIPTWRLPSYDSEQEAVNSILRYVREKYKKYSRNYKSDKVYYKGVKVWYNG